MTIEIIASGRAGLGRGERMSRQRNRRRCARGEMSLTNSGAISGPLISTSDPCFDAGPCGSRHDADAPIDVGDRAGEPPGKRRGQERRRETDIVDVDQFTDGRALDRLVQKKVKVLQT